MMNLIIRKAKNSDIQIISSYCIQNIEYHNKIKKHFDFVENYEEIFLNYTTQSMHNDSFCFYLAEMDGKTVGYIECEIQHQVNYTKSEFLGIINGIFIINEFRRHHIGRELVEKALIFCKEKNAEYVKVFYHSQNEIASKFWSSCGFIKKISIIERDLEKKLNTINEIDSNISVYSAKIENLNVVLDFFTKYSENLVSYLGVHHLNDDFQNIIHNNFISFINSKDNLVVISSIEGKFISCCQLTIMNSMYFEKSFKKAHFHFFYIEKEYQKDAIYNEIFRFIENWMRNNDIKRFSGKIENNKEKLINYLKSNEFELINYVGYKKIF